MEVRSGALVAGYRVEQVIGAGAMGTVYRAVDTRSGDRVALKVLAPELARDERFRQRFLRESQIAATLEHPHVAVTLAAGEEDGLLYLAMAYVEGADLRALLQREGRLEPRRAVELVSQVAGALDEAHRLGLVHRDVKPGNILVASGEGGERAYICDFGLARHVSSVSSLTGERGFVGTIDYVPPEQIEGGSIDGRADVYSLGCVLFECLTGARPFARHSELSVVFAHLNEPAPRPSELRPELPAALDELVATALAKAPEDRYGTCGELAAAARAALDGRPLRRRRASRRRVATVAIAAAAAVVGATVIAAVLATHGGGTTRGPRVAAPVLPLTPNAVSVLAPSAGRVLARVALEKRSLYGIEPTDVAFADGSAWILVQGRQRLVRVDPTTRRITANVALPWSPGPRIAAGGGLVWATEDGGAGVVGVDPHRARIVRRFTVPGHNAGGVAFGGAALWVAQGDDVVRVDPRSGRILRRVRNPGQSSATVWLAYADGAVWSARASGIVRKIDPLAGRISWAVHLDGFVSDIAVGGGYVWVPKVPDGLVYRLSEDDLSVAGGVQGGADPERIAVAGRDLWVANGTARTISRVDIGSGTRRQFRLSAQPTFVRYALGRLWAGARPSPQPLPPIRGSELRIAAGVNPEPTQAGSLLDEQRLYATCANLVMYPDAPGAAGTRLRPEVAAAMPAVSLGGRRYTFRIRRGFRFSPPSNQPVTAATFRDSIERALSPKLGITSSGAALFADLVGVAAYRAGHARHVRGIAVRGDVISLTLARPAGDLLTRLADGAACPVPHGQPIQPQGPERPVPSDGPYYVSSIEGDRTVLLRNPNYHGTRPRRPERIVYTDGIETPKAVALTDAGDLDVLPSADAPLTLGGSLEHAFGAGSAAARAGRQRYFREPMPWIDGVVLNASRPLFADVRVRRAVSYALDRKALARAFFDDPYDQIVPPAVVGFAPGRAYPLSPDLPKARRLAGTRRRHAVLSYCVNGVFGSPAQGRIAQLIRSQLAQIRIGVSIVRSNCNQDFRYHRTSEDADLIMFSNGSPERDPGPFLGWALDGRSYGAALGRGVWSRPSFRRRVEHAASLRGAVRTREYARLVGELMRAAPFAVYGSFASVEYLSPKVGCKVFERAGGFVDLGALCRR
jgi:ABC-type transport system substrate-binding protein/tRNA A-37 threonylcarbamoyl transferase component Bud32